MTSCERPEKGKVLRIARCWIVVSAGLAALIALGGLVYSDAFLPSGTYGEMVLFGIAYGLCLFVVLRLADCRKIPLKWWWPALIAAWLGPFVAGHLDNYRDVKYYAWKQVQKSADGTFDPAWKKLDRDELFPRYVERISGAQSGSAVAYVRLLTSAGWSGSERYGLTGPYQVHRTGFWIWLSWAWHFAVLLVAVCAAGGAALSDDAWPSKISTRLERRPRAGRTAAVGAAAPKPASSRREDAVPKSGARADDSFAESCLCLSFAQDARGAQTGEWTVILRFEGRSFVLRFLHPGEQPSAREVVERLSYEAYTARRHETFESWAAEAGQDAGSENARRVFAGLKEQEKALGRLLGRYYDSFLNDDRFGCMRTRVVQDGARSLCE